LPHLILDNHDFDGHASQRIPLQEASSNSMTKDEPHRHVSLKKHLGAEQLIVGI
jgi:hypothetical protein